MLVETGDTYKMKKLFKLITPLVLAPFFVISCGYSQHKVNLDMSDPRYDIHQLSSDDKIDFDQTGYGGNYFLSKEAYNNLYDQMGKNDVAIAIIANHKVYEEVVPYSPGDKVWDVMLRSRFEFKKYDHEALGVFVNSFRIKGETEWRHGTRTAQNYGDFYPLYYINHEFSQFGVSNWKIKSPHEVYELSYDDK